MKSLMIRFIILAGCIWLCLPCNCQYLDFNPSDRFDCDLKGPVKSVKTNWVRRYDQIDEFLRERYEKDRAEDYLEELLMFTESGLLAYGYKFSPSNDTLAITQFSWNKKGVPNEVFEENKQQQFSIHHEFTYFGKVLRKEVRSDETGITDSITYFLPGPQLKKITKWSKNSTNSETAIKRLNQSGSTIWECYFSKFPGDLTIYIRNKTEQNLLERVTYMNLSSVEQATWKGIIEDPSKFTDRDTFKDYLFQQILPPILDSIASEKSEEVLENWTIPVLGVQSLVLSKSLYNKAGLLIENSYDAGKTSHTLKYDNRGYLTQVNFLTSDQITESYTISIEYDRYNNWVKKVAFQGTEKVAELNREVAYY